jgi:hypothetical protein
MNMSHKKSYWAPALLGVCLSGVFSLVLIGNQGCTAKMPASTTFVATATPTVPPNVADNMDDCDSNMNPAMSGVNSSGSPLGFWVASSWGDPGNLINGAAGANVVFCGNVGANNTNGAIHLYGTIKDNGDGQYPSFQLEGKFKGSLYFDSTVYGYRGVRFYYKTGTDTCTFRRFNLPIAATSPPATGGYCATACYDHFGASLLATNGVWTQRSYYFNATLGTPFLQRQGFGSAITPATLSGNHLKQLIQVQWQFGRNGSAGTASVDYWIDEVEFF